MANLATFIPIALSVALCLALFKIHRLNSALEVQQADNVELMRETEKAEERSLMLEQRLKKETQERGGVELKYRELYKENKQNKDLAADTNTQLQYKVQANFDLTRELAEAKQQLEVKKKEVTKAAEEAIRYRDLFQAGNDRLNDVREAYEKLKQQVEAGVAKPSDIKVDVLKGGHVGSKGESVVRRDADEEEKAKVEGQNNVNKAQNETGKPQTEQNQVESPANTKKPSGQESTPQQQQQEEKKKEATQEAEKKEAAGEAKAEAKVEEEGKDGEQENDEREMPVAREERQVDEDEEEEEEEGQGEGENKREEKARRSVRMNKLLKKLRKRRA